MSRMVVQDTPVFFVPVGGISTTTLFLCWYEEGKWQQTTVSPPTNTTRHAFFGVRDTDRFVHLDTLVSPNVRTLRFFRLLRDPWRFEQEAIAVVPLGSSGIRAVASDRNAALVTITTDGFIEDAFVAKPDTEPVELLEWPASYFYPIGWNDGAILGIAFGRALKMQDDTGKLDLQEPGEVIGYGRCTDSQIYSLNEDGNTIRWFNTDPDFLEWEPFVSLDPDREWIPRCAISSRMGETTIFHMATPAGFDLLVGFNRQGNQLFAWPAEGFPLRAVSDDGRYVALYGRLDSRNSTVVMDMQTGESAHVFDRLGQVEFVSTHDDREFLVLADSWRNEIKIQDLGGATLRETIDPERVQDPHPYKVWAMANLDGDVDPLNAYPEADGDKDSLSNAMEFALGGSLTRNDVDLLPKIRRIDGTRASFEFQFRRVQTLDSRIQYIVEVSPSLEGESWDSERAQFEQLQPSVDNGDGTETVTVRVTPANGNAPLFTRLRIEIDGISDQN